MEQVEPTDEAGTTLTMSVDDSGDPVIVLVGEIDISNVETLRPDFDKATDGRPKRLVVDLEHVGFLDSSGLALFVAAAQRVGEVVLRHPSTLICRVIEATGLSEILQVERVREA